jgi:hypothetical protein
VGAHSPYHMKAMGQDQEDPWVRVTHFERRDYVPTDN